MKKAVFFLAGSLILASSAFAQNPDDPIAAFSTRPALGGSFQAAPSLRTLSATATAPAATVAANVEFGALTFVRGKGYAIPLSITNAPNLASIRVGFDKNPSFALLKAEDLAGSIVRQSDWQYNLTDISGVGKHAIEAEVTMRDGSKTTVSGSYMIPQCPESPLVALAPVTGDGSATFRASVTMPEFVKRVDFYYVSNYDGRGVIDSWDPNTQALPRQAYSTTYPTALRNGLAESTSYNLTDPLYRGYPFTGYVVPVVETLCGSKYKGDVQKFSTTWQAYAQMPVQTQTPLQPAVRIDIIANNDTIRGWATFRATVDTRGRAGRLIVHTSGAGIAIYPGWGDYNFFDGTNYPVFYMRQMSGPQTFTWTEYYFAGVQYTMVGALFLDNGKGGYDYLQGEVQFEGKWKIF
jgi:hypothetical protein